MTLAAPFTAEELRRPFLHVQTNTRYRFVYEVAGTYALESVSGGEKYAKAEELRDANIWRFAQ